MYLGQRQELARMKEHFEEIVCSTKAFAVSASKRNPLSVHWLQKGNINHKNYVFVCIYCVYVYSKILSELKARTMFFELFHLINDSSFKQRLLHVVCKSRM